MVHQFGDEESTKYSVWLVAKPKDVSTDELSSIKFPHKPKSSTKIESLQNGESTNNQKQVECKFNKPKSKTFYVEVQNIFQADKMNDLRPSAEIRGVAWINKHIPLDDFPLIFDEKE